jgi:hypothetical protein
MEEGEQDGQTNQHCPGCHAHTVPAVHMDHPKSFLRKQMQILYNTFFTVPKKKKRKKGVGGQEGEK